VDSGVAVAAVTGMFGVIIALVQLHGRRNRQDHRSVEGHLDRIEGKLDNHISDHWRRGV
jgi:hypothetical protein